MKIALAQINPTVGDFEGNAEKMLARVDQAAGLSCDLVVFSELVLSGFPPGDLLAMPDFAAAGSSCLDRLVKAARGIGVVFGAVTGAETEQGPGLFNTAILCDGGEILHETRKCGLSGYGILDERKYFEQGAETSPFSYKGHSIGLIIGEDLGDDKDPAAAGSRRTPLIGPMVKAGADLIINISASPYSVGKRRRKADTLADTAERYGVCLLHVNQVGGNDGIIFDGMSMAFDSRGALAARAADFEEDLIVFDTGTEKGHRHPVSGTDTESMLKALVLGTRDYARKCGFEKALVGLSGGIDSALTASIAVQAFGHENVTGVFMPSPYTSEQSHEDAKALAEHLRIEWIRVPIEPIFDRFLQSLSPVFGQSSHDLTEQNLQARVRSTLLMALSNRFGHLVLSTGNKSELAVGYATLYGDLSGGLAVISDVPKTQVYELARFINKHEEVIPASIIERAPTAELKPNQKDQDDLPPYEILDDILKAYVEENKGPEEIVAMGFDASTVNDVIRRVDRNEYKRHQAPPGLRVTSRSFGIERKCPLAWRSWR